MKFCCANYGVIFSPSSHETPVKSALPNYTLALLLKGEEWNVQKGSVFEKVPVSDPRPPKGLSLTGQHSTISKEGGLALHFSPLL